MPEWRPTPKKLEKYRLQVLERLAGVPGELAEKLRAIAASDYAPDAWEHGFIQSTSISVASARVLSEKQLEKLNELVDRAKEPRRSKKI